MMNFNPLIFNNLMNKSGSDSSVKNSSLYLFSDIIKICYDTDENSGGSADGKLNIPEEKDLTNIFKNVTNSIEKSSLNMKTSSLFDSSFLTTMVTNKISSDKASALNSNIISDKTINIGDLKKLLSVLNALITNIQAGNNTAGQKNQLQLNDILSAINSGKTLNIKVPVDDKVITIVLNSETVKTSKEELKDSNKDVKTEDNNVDTSQIFPLISLLIKVDDKKTENVASTTDNIIVGNEVKSDSKVETVLDQETEDTDGVVSTSPKTLTNEESTVENINLNNSDNISEDIESEIAKAVSSNTLDNNISKDALKVENVLGVESSQVISKNNYAMKAEGAIDSAINTSLKNSKINDSANTISNSASGVQQDKVEAKNNIIDYTINGTNENLKTDDILKNLVNSITGNKQNDIEVIKIKKAKDSVLNVIVKNDDLNNKKLNVNNELDVLDDIASNKEKVFVNDKYSYLLKDVKDIDIKTVATNSPKLNADKAGVNEDLDIASIKDQTFITSKENDSDKNSKETINNSESVKLDKVNDTVSNKIIAKAIDSNLSTSGSKENNFAIDGAEDSLKNVILKSNNAQAINPVTINDKEIKKASKDDNTTEKISSSTGAKQSNETENVKTNSNNKDTGSNLFNNNSQLHTNDKEIVIKPKFSEIFQMNYNEEKWIKADKLFSEMQKVISSNENKSVTLNLMPEDLGKVKVMVETTGKVVEAKIEVQNENVKGVVQNNIEQLKQSLNQNGVHVNSIAVSVSYQESKNHKSSDTKKKNSSQEKNISINQNKESVKNEAKVLGYNTYEYLV